MPTSVAELQVLLTARDEASARLQVMGKEVQGLEREVEKASGAFGRLGGVVRGLGQLGLAAGGIGAIVGGFQTAIGAVGGLVDQASDLNEQLSRSGAIFGEAAGAVQEFSKTTAQSLGITRTEALEAAGSFGTLFRTAGLSEDAAADMSTELVRLAADLASFNNLDPREALDKLRSGLVGEAEPLRSVGVLLSEDAVKQEALRLGLARTATELTEANRVQARYSLILQQTASAQGDFARTSTGLANAQRIIRASWADLTATLGSAFLPVVARAASFLAQQLPRALQVVQQVTDQLGPALAALFSGDLQGALDRAVALVGTLAAALAPQLARWTQAFLDWVGVMTPRLLEYLGDRLGDLWQWIRETAPGLLERAVGEWIPAMVRWVDEVGPKVLAALLQLLKELGAWIKDTGAPQLAAFGKDLGEALVRGFGKALEQLGPALGKALDDAFANNPIIASLIAGALVPGGGTALQPGVRGTAAGTLPQVAGGVAAVAGAAGRVHVEIHGMDLYVGVDPREAAHEAGAAVEARVYEALTQSAAATDPGAGSRLQGAGRAP